DLCHETRHCCYETTRDISLSTYATSIADTTSERPTYATIVTDTTSDTNTTSTYVVTKKNNRFDQKVFSEKTKDLCHETQHLRLGGTCLMIMSKRIITVNLFTA
ncbi:hypothetical protein CDAR_448331, partial [Caerostris darwini]